MDSNVFMKLFKFDYVCIRCVINITNHSYNKTFINNHWMTKNKIKKIIYITFKKSIIGVICRTKKYPF